MARSKAGISAGNKSTQFQNGSVTGLRAKSESKVQSPLKSKLKSAMQPSSLKRNASNKTLKMTEGGKPILGQKLTFVQKSSNIVSSKAITL